VLIERGFSPMCPLAPDPGRPSTSECVPLMLSMGTKGLEHWPANLLRLRLPKVAIREGYIS
jgi:hypothetical protein